MEGPKAFEAVIETAEEYGITIHRISQGSGVMLLTDEEIMVMADLGRQERMEVSLFVGPRAAFDIGSMALTPAGKIIGLRLRGTDQLVHAIEDVKRACELGIRGVLVADEELLYVLGEMKLSGELPGDLCIKISVQMGSSNPASIVLMEQLGAGTYNVSYAADVELDTKCYRYPHRPVR